MATINGYFINAILRLRNPNYKCITCLIFDLYNIYLMPYISIEGKQFLINLKEKYSLNYRHRELRDKFFKSQKTPVVIQRWFLIYYAHIRKSQLLF